MPGRPGCCAWSTGRLRGGRRSRRRLAGSAGTDTMTMPEDNSSRPPEGRSGVPTTISTRATQLPGDGPRLRAARTRGTDAMTDDLAEETADPLVVLLEEIQAGQGISLAAAVRPLPAHRGSGRVNAATAFRWATKGVKVPGG